MSSLDLTRDWLKNVLKPYSARDRLLEDVLSVLRDRRGLAVKTEAFTFDNGQTALLLLIHGTLPISYRGATYHIPIHVWIPHEYPRSPPLPFVVPTKEMGVRKGREVDPGGKVNEEVTDGWWRSWPDKSIEMLLRQLVAVFSATPPVYARPPEQQAGSSAPSSPAQVNGHPPEAGPSRPPPPPARPTGPPSSLEALPTYRPAPTPPPLAYNQNQPYSPPRQFSGASHSSNQPPLPTSSPPVPDRPPRIPSKQLSGSSVGAPNLPQRPLSAQFPPNGTASPALGPQVQSHHRGPIAFTPPLQQYDNPPQNWQPPPQPHAEPLQTYSGQYAQQPPLSNQPITHYAPLAAEHPQRAPPVPSRNVSQPLNPPTQPPRQVAQPPQDLMSSPEQTTVPLPADPNAPPPPPPLKPPPPSLLHLHSILLPHLNAALPSLLSSLQNNRQHLLDRREDLASGEPAIRDEMARLEAVKKVCDSVGRKMDDAVGKIGERVTELESKGEVSVDELVCGISIVHNQLIDLVAEDNAIEDTIFHMTRALDAERIDLDRFLKSIRLLAREQYMKRALIERILQAMGQQQGW